MIIVVVLTALTLITLDTRNGRTGVLGALGRLAHRVVGPVEGAVDDVAQPVSDWWHGVTDAGHLERDNRKLRRELQAAQGQARDGEHATAENADLRAQLNLNDILLAKHVTALIVNRDQGNFDQTIEINRGQASGIQTDMAVVSPAGLVGRVIEVWSTGAKIRVLTDPLFRVTVRTTGHPGVPPASDIARGVVGSGDLAILFGSGSKVAVGDALYTAPELSVFPPDLAVGTIKTVKEEPGGIGIDATIRPYVDLGALDYVTVVEWAPGQPPAIATTTTTTTTTTTMTTVPSLFATTTTTLPGH